MTDFEKLSLLFSCIAFIISVIVYFKNKLYSSAALEASIFAQIASAKVALTEATENVTIFSEDHSPLGIHEMNNFSSAQKDLLKAYEFACQHYFSNAINHNHFKQLYDSEIKQLFSESSYYEIIYTGSYPNLKKFHNNK